MVLVLVVVLFPSLPGTDYKEKMEAQTLDVKAVKDILTGVQGQGNGQSVGGQGQQQNNGPPPPTPHPPGLIPQNVACA